MAGVFLPAGYKMVLTANSTSPGSYYLVGDYSSYEEVSITETIAPSAIGRNYIVENLLVTQTPSLPTELTGATITDSEISDSTLGSLLETSVSVGTVVELAGLSANVKGNGIINTVEFTLDNFEVSINSSGSGNGFGGMQLYTFNPGHLYILGCTSDLSLAVTDVISQAKFSNNSPSGDIAIGTDVIFNDDAMGTDSTDDDLGNSEQIAMFLFEQEDIKMAPNLYGMLDNTIIPKPLCLNILIDAADIEDDIIGAVIKVSGTIKLTVIQLGDYS